MHIGVNTLSVIPGRTGGGETYLLGLLGAMSRLESGHRLTLFASARNHTLFREQLPTCEIVTTTRRRSRLGRVFHEHLRLPKEIKQRDIDLLFSPGNAAIPVNGCAQVVAIQSMLYHLAPQETGWARRRYFKSVVPWSVQQSDLAVAVSQDTKRLIHEVVSVPDDRVRVVYEGVDPIFAPPNADSGQAVLDRFNLKPGYILFVSTLKPYKNADKLIRACGLLQKRKELKPTVAIVGRDPLGLTPSLKDLARSAGIADTVQFIGPVEHTTLPALYANACVFVFPSVIETFGLPVLEAMACGTPVIGSDRSAVKEIVAAAGVTVDPDRVEALADAIEKVLTDRAFHDTLRDASLAHARQFTWERAARETLSVFEEARARWQAHHAAGAES